MTQKLQRFTQMKTKTFLLLVADVVILTSFSCKRSQQISPSLPPSSTPPNLTPIKTPPPAILGKPYPGKGVVKLINRKEGWIEIDHEEIVDLMPAMEMEWFVEKSSLLDGLKVGYKVTFTVVETQKRGQILTSIKKLQE